jgi:hypothetical protein
MYPTVAAAMAAGCPWLHFICAICHQRNAVDLRRFEQHRAASVSGIIPEIACTTANGPARFVFSA